MQRSSIIATVIATGGILIAGSVASVAVINAASTSQPGSTSAELVAAAAPTSTQSAEIGQTESPEPSTSPTPLPSLSDEPLPDLPEVSKQPAASQQQVVAAPPVQKSASAKPKPKATKSPKPTKSASASATQEPDSKKTESPEAAVRSISVDKAVAVVLDATNGGVIQTAEEVSRGGYDAWAITVLRGDGSVITGFVDRTSGVAFDWVVVREAPAPAASATSGSSGSDDDHEDDDHKSDDHEDDGDDD